MHGASNECSVHREWMKLSMQRSLQRVRVHTHISLDVFFASQNRRVYGEESSTTVGERERAEWKCNECEKEFEYLKVDRVEL
jgi:hypothetical protein